MLEHTRRIFIALAILLASGFMYQGWRSNHGGYGLFDLLSGKKELAVLQIPIATSAKLTDADVPILAKISEESAKLAAAVLPSVVSINTVSAQEVRDMFGFLRGYRAAPGLGSGVIVSKEGHIVTNYHVVKDVALVQNVPQIKVTLDDGTTYAAEFINADPALDIAVIRIKGGKKDFPALEFADSEKVKTGETVFAVGNPFGLSGTVTRGIISATQRRLSDSVSDLLQTDTVINPGNSGGPLVNVRGEIVGINVAIFMGAEKVHSWQGVGLAIPSNDAKEALQSILKQGVPLSGYLGIEVQPQPVAVDSTLGGSIVGAMVETVLPDSPAAIAGLKKGDVITKFSGRTFNDIRTLMLLIRKTKPGQQLAIVVVREGKLLTLNALIQPRPPGK